MTKITTLILILLSTQVLADVSITVNKGEADLCEVIPTQAKQYNGRNAHHYNKLANPREISSDLWQSGKNGLAFFRLSKSESQSQTVQLALVDKYSTFWYYTKNGADEKGPYFYDFVVPESDGSAFVDINLDLPCSCFKPSDKPQRCSPHHTSSALRKNVFQDDLGNWWEQINHDTAKKIIY